MASQKGLQLERVKPFKATKSSTQMNCELKETFGRRHLSSKLSKKKEKFIRAMTILSKASHKLQAFSQWKPQAEEANEHKKKKKKSLLGSHGIQISSLCCSSVEEVNKIEIRTNATRSTRRATMDQWEKEIPLENSALFHTFQTNQRGRTLEFREKSWQECGQGRGTVRCKSRRAARAVDERDSTSGVEGWPWFGSRENDSTYLYHARRDESLG